MLQVRREYGFTDGRVIVRGQLATRGQRRRADYLLFFGPNLPLAVIEAKDPTHSLGAGIQQALAYAETLDLPFAFASNGAGFVFHDRTVGSGPNGTDGPVERTLTLDEFPSPAALWQRYRAWKGLTDDTEKLARFPYHDDASGKEPRYYQRIAIQRVIEAVAAGDRRQLLVMATGTGKTYTAFQIIWRLWKAGIVKRVLFLADRNILVDQTMTNDFKPFGPVMTKVQNRTIDKSFEVYLALYQAITGTEPEQQIFRQFSPDFFDLIIVDECHRGSARDNSAWRDILDWFSSAIQLGLTATPKETSDISTQTYFGEPIYTYSLKQGIDDGFLAPYKVVRIDFDKDLFGWRPPVGTTDDAGVTVEDRVYNQRDMDRALILPLRTRAVARKIVDYLHATDPWSKTIVFCEDIDHAERMRSALVNEFALRPPPGADDIPLFKQIVRITGDSDDGKRALDDFIHPEKRLPIIATTSKLLTTGVDAKTCKLIVLDQRIESLIEFKQIVGRGTRIHEDTGKLWFTVMDFKRATELFADPDFDGDPVVIYEPGPDEPVNPPDPEGDPPGEPDPGPAPPALVQAPVQARTPGVRATSSAGSTSPSSASASSTTTPMGASSPSRSKTTPATPYAPSMRASTTSCGAGRPRTKRTSSSTSSKNKACSSTPCASTPTATSIPSTSSATSSTTSRRSPAKSAPTMCANATSSPVLVAPPARCSTRCSTSMPTRESCRTTSVCSGCTRSPTWGPPSSWSTSSAARMATSRRSARSSASCTEM